MLSEPLEALSLLTNIGSVALAVAAVSLSAYFTWATYSATRYLRRTLKALNAGQADAEQFLLALHEIEKEKGSNAISKSALISVDVAVSSNSVYQAITSLSDANQNRIFEVLASPSDTSRRDYILDLLPDAKRSANS